MALRRNILMQCVLWLCFGLCMVFADDDIRPQIDAAVYILSDLPETLAVPFCSEYIHYHETTATYTVTEDPVTITSTIPCYSTTPPGPDPTTTPHPEPSPSRQTSGPTAPPVTTPWVSTVTSTTTTTYHTTSTIYVQPAQAPMQLKKRETKFLDDVALVERATWCDGFDVPCRLVQYRRNVIAPACERYLGGGEVVTATVTVGSWETKTRVVDGCATGVVYGAGREGKGDHGGKKKGGGKKGGYKGKERGGHGDEVGEVDAQDPSDDLEFMDEFCWDC